MQFVGHSSQRLIQCVLISKPHRLCECLLQSVRAHGFAGLLHEVLRVVVRLHSGGGQKQESITLVPPPHVAAVASACAAWPVDQYCKTPNLIRDKLFCTSPCGLARWLGLDFGSAGRVGAALTCMVRAVQYCTVLYMHGARGAANFSGSRARVLGKKSTNPAEFCMHY